MRKYTDDFWQFCVTGVMWINGTPCRREVELGLDEKKAGSHDGTTLTHFLLENVGLDYQSQSTARTYIRWKHGGELDLEESHYPRGQKIRSCPF